MPGNVRRRAATCSTSSIVVRSRSASRADDGQRARPVQVEAYAQQIVSAQSSHDLGSRRGDQPERTRRSLAVAASEAPPTLAGFVGGDALAEYRVHRDLDRIGTGGEPHAGEAAHERGQRLVVGDEVERTVVETGQRGRPGQHVGTAVAPDVDDQRLRHGV